jgi:hypothetical protein
MPESYQTISNLLEIEEFEAIQATNTLGDVWFENGRVSETKLCSIQVPIQILGKMNIETT